MVKSTFLDKNRDHMEQKLFFRLVQERLTALPPPASLFWSPALCWPSVFWAVGWQKSQVSPTALFILSRCLLYAPRRARHNATLRKYLNLVPFFSCSASEKWEKKEKKRSKRYLPICSEQRTCSSCCGRPARCGLTAHRGNKRHPPEDREKK